MEKNTHLKRLQDLGPLEVLRADLEDEGSVDEALAGCYYAFFVAAPVNLASKNLRCTPYHYLKRLAGKNLTVEIKKNTTVEINCIPLNLHMWYRWYINIIKKIIPMTTRPQTICAGG
jgi:hypothetical protein